MNVSEIAIRVKRQFGDEAGAQIGDADIIRWINDAQREIAYNNDLLQTTAKTNVISDLGKYTLPSDILTTRSVRFAGKKLVFLSPEEAATLYDTDELPKGVPTHYSIWATQITLYPVPDKEDDDDLQLYYTRQPRLVEAPSDVPELPQQYHNRIVEYCIAQAYELDDNMESYQQKMRQFQEGVDRLKVNADWQEQAVYPSISVSPADYGDGY